MLPGLEIQNDGPEEVCSPQNLLVTSLLRSPLGPSPRLPYGQHGSKQENPAAECTERTPALEILLLPHQDVVVPEPSKDHKLKHFLFKQK